MHPRIHRTPNEHGPVQGACHHILIQTAILTVTLMAFPNGLLGEPDPTPPDATEPQGATIHITLTDATHQEPIPGWIRVLDADDQPLNIDGLLSRAAYLRSNHPAQHWYALPEPSSATIPANAATLEALSGLEYERATLKLPAQRGNEDTLSIPIRRFWTQAGWSSGNTHLHLKGIDRTQADDYLRQIPLADRLDLLFVSHLERIDDDRTYITNEYGRRAIEALSTANLRYGYGEEHRHNFGPWDEGYGHVMLLNLQRLTDPVSVGPGIMGKGVDFPTLSRGIEDAREQGATVIWCHNRFGLEDLPNWLAGRVHAQNIFDGGSHGSYEDSFYRYLELGMRVPFSTGTDWFIYDLSRVYVQVGDSTSNPPSLDAWLNSLVRGRSFITNGPLLTLQVDDIEIGGTARVDRPTRLRIRAGAAGRTDFNGVEVIHNGDPIHTASTTARQNHFVAEVDIEWTAGEPGWLALRVPNPGLPVPASTPSRASGVPTNELGEPIFAHTSPIYIDYQGKRRFDPAIATELQEELRESIATIRTQGIFDDQAQRTTVLNAYRTALTHLEKLPQD